jgi:hypothetical protein
MNAENVVHQVERTKVYDGANHTYETEFQESNQILTP